MKEFYKDANIGPAIDVKFKATSHITPNIRKVIGGWTLVPDNQLKQVWKHINYTLHTCTTWLCIWLCQYVIKKTCIGLWINSRNLLSLEYVAVIIYSHSYTTKDTMYCNKTSQLMPTMHDDQLECFALNADWQQCDVFVVGASLSEPHIDHDNGSRELSTCIFSTCISFFSCVKPHPPTLVEIRLASDY